MINFSILYLEIAVSLLALGLLVGEMFLPQIPKYKFGLSAVFGMLFLLLWSFFPGSDLNNPNLVSTNYFYTLDHLAIWGKQFSILATGLSIWMSLHFFKKDEKYFVEYIVLQLITCVGMMLVVSVTDLFTLFVSLELLTISFYILVSFKKSDVLCLEAGIKYLIYGALASGILLYGISLIYGMSGQHQFTAIAQYAAQHLDSTLLIIGLILVLIGIAFKLAAFPFHWWAADVYEGAPTPTVALLSTGSKGAGVILLIRILFEVFPRHQAIWLPLICFAAGSSILFGNLGALSQTNFKRLMGY